MLPMFFGERLREHVKINNWANGWKIEGNEKYSYVIVFWPQYLQYAGFVVLALTLIVLLLPMGWTKRLSPSHRTTPKTHQTL